MDWADFSTGATQETLGLKGLFHVGDYFAAMSHGWALQIRHPPSQQALEQRLWQHRKKKRCPWAKAFSQTCKSPVQTLSLLGWGMFSCRAQGLFSTGAVLHGVANAYKRFLYSKRSPSDALLLEMEGIALQLLTYQKSSPNTELWYAKGDGAWPQLCFVTKEWLGRDVLQERVHGYKSKAWAGTSTAQSKVSISICRSLQMILAIFCRLT